MDYLGNFLPTRLLIDRGRGALASTAISGSMSPRLLSILAAQRPAGLVLCDLLYVNTDAEFPEHSGPIKSGQPSASLAVAPTRPLLRWHATIRRGATGNA